MRAHKTVALHTLGCKLNFSETSAIGRSLEKAGYHQVPWGDRSDLCVINTCSVTENANRKCRKVINQARRVSPDSVVAVVGCYAQLKPQEIADIEHVDLVLGTAEKFRLAEHLERAGKTGCEVHVSEIGNARRFESSFSFGERTRAYLKVQDGCDYSCSYCTIPIARGVSRSDTIKNVVARADKLGSSGVPEIVLTGVNTGDFGLDGNGRRRERFIDLLQALDAVESVLRFRISSIEPNLLSEEIIEFVAGSKLFTPHFHVPLQSGSDHVLNLMRRRYLSGLYASRVELIKQYMPHACIGADVIVGFPGETQGHFEETYQFLQDLDVSYLHVFPYSERPGTEATRIGNPVTLADREFRGRQLRHLSSTKRAHFYGNQLGVTRQVLIEEVSDGMAEGFTENYIRTKLATNSLQIGEAAEVLLDRQLVSGEVLALLPELVTA